MYQLFAKKMSLLFLALSFTATMAIAQKGATVAVTSVIHIDAVPQYTQLIIPILNSYLHDTQHDKGIIRCKIFQEVGRPNHFTLVEEWADQAAYDAHVGQAGARQFREQIQPMLGAPVDERLHTELK